jgi:hypothetical protein
MHTDVHPSTGIQTHDLSVRARDDGSCLRLRGHSDPQSGMQGAEIPVFSLIDIRALLSYLLTFSFLNKCKRMQIDSADIHADLTAVWADFQEPG